MPVSDAKRKSNDKYNAKCDYIAIKPLKPIGEKIRQSAKAKGKSLQGYILDAVDKQIAEDENGQEIPSEVIAKSIEWLKDHDHTNDDVIDYMEYISK